MNTEPPNGDDLQRMLVAMKREVLTRAEAEKPRKRRHSRVGIGVAVIGLLAVGTASGALALGAVQQRTEQAPVAASSPEPSASRTPAGAPFTPSPQPSRSVPPTSAPTPTATPVALDPDRKVCEQIVPTADYDRLFGPGAPLQGGSFVGDAADTEWPHPTDPALSFLGDPSLYCLFRDPQADVSGIDVTIGKASAEQLAARADRLVQQGGSCEEQPDGQVCQLTVPVEGYPVDHTDTFSVRGDTYIEVGQTNAPTSGLLAAIDEAGVVDTIVGDAPRG